MWYNSIMSFLLRSPAHALLSKNMMLITVTGRKSGRSITTPVSYVREGDTLWVISSRDRTWWRNLIGGAPVTLHLAGREVKGVAEAILDEAAVAARLTAHLSAQPGMARYLNVRLEQGQPRADDIAHFAQLRLFIRIELVEE